ncbi:hypothetical protein KBY97_00905 [Synechococcus sp. ATX 2A4]|uniref:hypothetical protein n=1 Tax=Synechococcus sp. ATX 2A4 TaxID=2823727 RepID=UPI0020CC599F|nr:hypothetical protein [Synechococcus sp. ATX 2A4]MCP9883686.1 hypothetical protein [Synechococcus sp. ATX 2A4]
MPREQAVILLLAVGAVGVGTTAAILQPALFRLGQEGTPASFSGVRYGGSYRAGRWVAAPDRSRAWSGFQGRGPGTAK